MLAYYFHINFSLLRFTENLLTEDIDLIEGDMKLTIDQKLELVAGYHGDINSKATKLWPGGVIIFDIDPSLGKTSVFFCTTFCVN